MAGEKIYIHIVWSPATGPIVAYVRAGTAHDHARAMLGVQDTSIELREAIDPEMANMRLPGAKVDECELRNALAPEAVDDIYVAELEDFEDETPVDELPPPPDATKP